MIIGSRALIALAALAAAPAEASDACATRAIETAAKVSVSNGRSYATRTYFRARNEAAIDFINEATETIAVEGPLAWTRSATGSALAGDAEKGFALGHQFHALLLHFDEIFPDAEPDDAISFRGETARGRSATSPYGGAARIVRGQDRPRGLVLQPPDYPREPHRPRRSALL